MGRFRYRKQLLCAAAVVATCMIPCAAARAEPLPPPPVDPTTQPSLADGLTIDVKAFEFTGNTAVSTEMLNQAAERKMQEFGTRRITSEQLEEVRKTVTAVYTGTPDNPRFVNSGARLDDQNPQSGIIRFTIVEGRLSGINVAPAKSGDATMKVYLKDSYVIDRISTAVDQPLDLERLRDRLEILRNDPNIARLNAELRPGAAAGESELDVMIAEANRFTASLAFNNYRSVSSGAEEFEAYFSARDLSGYGDLLNIRYGITQGGFEAMEFAGANDFSIDYTVPVSPQDTTISFAVLRSNDSVVEEPFADLDIDSDSISLGLTLRHPIYRTTTTELALFASVEYRENETTVLGDNFSFDIGAEDGKSRVFPLRFGQDFSYASATGAWGFAARSVFTIGTDWFTGNSGERQLDAQGNPLPFADAQFFTWLGQVQYVRKLDARNNRLILRGGAQLADDSLLSIEQFSLGGVGSVRGYRENRIVRDQGLTGTAELRLPVIQRGGRSVLELVPFADCGYGFNYDSGMESSEFISSAGVGVVFTPNQNVLAEVYYGYPFNKFDNRDDLSDIGIHFNFAISMRW